METGDAKWRRWPLPGVSAAYSLDFMPTKVASEPPDMSLEALAVRAVSEASSWAGELPPGISKVAAQRNGGEGELPEVTKKSLWRHPNAHPMSLLMMVLDMYGNESMEWAPETLLVTLRRDGIELSNANRTKLLASRVAVQSPSPWRQWEVFHMVSLGLAGQQPNMVYMEEPEIGHLVAGYDFMKIVDPERDTSEEVDKFVAAVFKYEGLPYAPEPLDFAQVELEERKLHCTNCDAIQKDDNDQRCITCGSPSLEKIPYEHAALRDSVASMWNSLKSQPLESAVDRVPGTAAGNAVYHLLVHWDYANQVRAQMVQQLRALSKS